jgi:hypothetical protein
MTGVWRPTAALVMVGFMACAGAAYAAPAGEAAGVPPRSSPQAATNTPRQLTRVDLRRRRDMPSNVFLAVDAAWQAAPSDATETDTFPAYEETGSVSATYRAKSRTVPQVSGGLRVWHGLWLGAAFSRYSTSESATMSIDVPHPFFFDQPRHVTGASPNATHTETTVEIDAAWLVPLNRRVELRLFAGPAVVRVRQDLVSDYSYTDTYPFDTIEFDHATLAAASTSTVGIAAGADVSVYLRPHFGVGFDARYTHASADVDTPLGARLRLATGGARIGGGLRVRF